MFKSVEIHKKLQNKKMIADGIFNSVVIYSVCVWGRGCDNKDIYINTMQILQTRDADLVAKIPPRTKRIIFFDKIGWLTNGSANY